MKRSKLLFIIFVMGLFIPLNLLAQAPKSDPDPRGVHVLAKDKQTGKEKMVPLYKKIYGVIIGIDSYQNLPPDQQLHYPVKDAKAIEKLLKERFVFDEIIKLHNIEASRESIMAILNGKLGQTDPNDAVFIFFAGHGFTEITKYGDLGYLVPYDGSVNKGELYKNISMTQLKEEVGKAIPAKHIFFMIDACYGGLMVMRGGNTPSIRRDFDYMEKITQETTRQVLAAGGKNERVWDGGPHGHSVFMGRVLQALNETVDFLTASELSVKVKEGVFSDARGMGHSQTPAFGAFWGEGDFVFVPKADTRLEELQTETLKLQAQLEEAKKQIKEAERINSEKKILEARNKENDIRIKLRLQQLEQERLKKEEEKKARLEEEAKKAVNEEIQKQADLENQKKQEEKKMAELRQKITEENAKLKEIKKEILSVEAAKKEVSELEAKISAADSLVTPEKEKALKELKTAYDLLLEKEKNIPIPPKGQFETTADYEKRLEIHDQKIREINQKLETESSELSNRYQQEYESWVKPYQDQIEILKSKKYPIEGLSAELLNYNADDEVFFVCLVEPSGKRNYCSFKLQPEIAKQIYDRKELLKVEGYYNDLLDNRLGEVFVIDPSAGKFPLTFPKNPLRAFRFPLTPDEVVKMVREKGFYDSDYNPNIKVKKTLESLTINGEKVILDFSTGLMWHPDGSTKNQWLKKLNETGYAGYKDWRLPTLEEAASLLIPNSFIYINPLFSLRGTMLTSDPDSSNVDIWMIDFLEGRIRLFKSYSDYYSCPVRFINGEYSE
ncbi:MAG: caspase family protein [Candidatus Omnitrophota bacterium]